jgi:hypothetical protein
MTILVDTCVCSLALRRDAQVQLPKVQALKEASSRSCASGMRRIY